MFRKILVCSFLITSTLFANEEISKLEVTNDKSFVADMLSDLSVPISTPALFVTLSGIATTSTFWAIEKNNDNSTQKESQENKTLGKFSNYGDLLGQGIPNGIYFTSFLMDDLIWKNHSSFKKAMLMLKATSYAGTVSTLLKWTTHQSRPGNKNEKTSFPSGHTTMAFAFAGVVMQEHEWYWGTMAFALASFVGFSRINDNRHYIYDVLGGATIGLAYGMGIPMRDSGKSYFFTLHPTSSPQGLPMLSASYFLKF